MTFPTDRRVLVPLACLCLGAVVGVLATRRDPALHGQPGGPGDRPREGPRLAPESAAAYDPNWDKDDPQYQRLGKGLKQVPDLRPGQIAPQDLSGFGGAGRVTSGSIDQVGSFDDHYRKCVAAKPKLMAERRKYMELRYHFT